MKKSLIYLASVFAFNTAIAGVMSIVMPQISFRNQLIFSHCIGWSMSLVCFFFLAVLQKGIWRTVAMAVSMPLTAALGVSLGLYFTGLDRKFLLSVLVALFFGFIAVLTFYLVERIETEIKQKKLLKSESEKREIEAHLKLLQAQIEPHFLFNTLANVSSLIDSNPELAKHLLDRLDDWLRVALARARSGNTTLGDELDMLENHLEIMKVRFGDRLRWRIDVSEDARRSAFPPMLLQPLVENAVRHGIEPKVGGGEIGILSSIDNTTLSIKVIDNGIGLDKNSAPTGVGLENVRARLGALFGDAGKLILQGNDECGATATLILPIKT